MSSPPTAYKPLSSFTLSSPAPLSSAGLSSHLPDRPTYRLSTLLPNPSGYLGFFRMTSAEDKDQDREHGQDQMRGRGQKKRSRSLSASLSFDLRAFFPSIPGRIKRSFSHSDNALPGQTTVYAPDARSLNNQDDSRLRGVVAEAGGLDTGRLPKLRSELNSVEKDWRIRSDGLKEEYRLCLLGARCISIHDPLRDLQDTDQRVQSTIIVDSADDPLSHLPSLTTPIHHHHQSELEFTPPQLKSHIDRASLSPILSSPPSDLALDQSHPSSEGEVGVEVATKTVLLSDVRAGTMAGSTRRAPTQKSVHPALGRKGEFGRETVWPRDLGSAGVQQPNKNSRLLIANRDVSRQLQPEEEDLSVDTVMSNKTIGTPTSPGVSSLPTTVDHTLPAAQALLIPGHDVYGMRIGRQSLVLDPDEYEYLVSLQARGWRSSYVPQLSGEVSHPAEIASQLGQTTSTSTDIHQGLDVELPRAQFRSTFDPPAHHSAEASSSCLTGAEEGRARGRHPTSRSQEYFRRSYVREYNESPTPDTAWVVVNPSGSAANGFGVTTGEHAPHDCDGGVKSKGRGLRRNVGRVRGWKRKRREE